MDLSQVPTEQLVGMLKQKRLNNAQIQAESAGNPYAVSPKGAQGIMQIMPATARDPGFGVTPLRNWDGKNPMSAPVEEQIRFGQDYRNAMQGRYNDPKLALAAYNAGPGAVDNHLKTGSPLPKETTNYVSNITRSLEGNYAYQQPNQSPKSDLSQFSNEQLMEMLKKKRQGSIVPQNPVQEMKPETTGLGAFGAGVGQSIPFMEEAAAGLYSLTHDGASYEDTLKSFRQGNEQYAEERPAAFYSGMIAPALVPVGAAAKGAGVVAKGGKLLPKVLKGAGIGAAQGATYGFGSGEGGFQNRLDSAETGAAIGGAIGGAVPLVKPALSAANKALGKSIIPNADQVRELASKSYKFAEESGGILKPEFTNKFVDEIERLKPQTEVGKLIGGDSAFSKAVDKFSAIRDKPISLDAAQEVDELLGDAVDEFFVNGSLSKQGKKLLDIQTTFRNMINEAPESSVIGGKEGFQALKKGRELWATSRRLADIERIINRAELTDNPATAIKTGMRTLLTNPSRMRGFSEAEKKAIKKAAENGILPDTLRIFGSRLIPIISASSGGGLGGTAAAAVGSKVSRSLAEQMQMNRANRVAGLVASKAIPVVRKPLIGK